MARFSRKRKKRKKRFAILTKIVSSKRGNRLIIVSPGIRRP